jgi:hypothetical protein
VFLRVIGAAVRPPPDFNNIWLAVWLLVTNGPPLCDLVSCTSFSTGQLSRREFVLEKHPFPTPPT